MESSSGSLSGRVLEALCDDVELMYLVKECRKLEESFGTQHVETVLRGNAAAAKEMKETIYQQDGQKLGDRCWEKVPVIAKVARRVGWAQLWDATLDIGGIAVRGLQMLSRVMSHHGRGKPTLSTCGVMQQPSSHQCWTTFWNTIKQSSSWSLSLM